MELLQGSYYLQDLIFYSAGKGMYVCVWVCAYMFLSICTHMDFFAHVEQFHLHAGVRRTCNHLLLYCSVLLENIYSEHVPYRWTVKELVSIFM